MVGTYILSLSLYHINIWREEGAAGSNHGGSRNKYYGIVYRHGKQTDTKMQIQNTAMIVIS